MISRVDKLKYKYREIFGVRPAPRRPGGRMADATAGCGICLERVHDRGVLEGVCDHQFCFTCIMRWAHASSASGSGASDERDACCPLCRKPFVAVRRSQTGRMVVVALDDGNSEEAGANETRDPNCSSRIVAGRRMRKRRGRSQALKAYRSAREKHLLSVAARLKILRESIRREREDCRSGSSHSRASASSASFDHSLGASNDTLEEHERKNKAAMRRADPSSDVFARLRRTQRLIEELKRLESDGNTKRVDQKTRRQGKQNCSKKKKKRRRIGN